MIPFPNSQELLELDLPPEAITLKRLHSRFCLQNPFVLPPPSPLLFSSLLTRPPSSPCRFLPAPTRELLCWSFWAPFISNFDLALVLEDHLSNLVEHNILEREEVERVWDGVRRGKEGVESYWEWRERIARRRKGRKRGIEGGEGRGVKRLMEEEMEEVVFVRKSTR